MMFVALCCDAVFGSSGCEGGLDAIRNYTRVECKARKRRGVIKVRRRVWKDACLRLGETMTLVAGRW